MKKLNRHLINRYKLILIPIVLCLLVLVYLICTGWFSEMIITNGTSQMEGDEQSLDLGFFVSHREGEEQYFEFECTVISGDVEVLIYDIDCEIKSEILNSKTDKDFILLDTYTFTESQTWSLDLSSYPYNRNYLVEVLSGDETDDYEFVYTYYTKKARWRNLLDKITGYDT